MEEWIKKLWYIYTMEYYSAIKKNELLPFVTMWMDLEGIMLRKINQSEKNKYHMISLICRIRRTIQTNKTKVDLQTQRAD